MLALSAAHITEESRVGIPWGGTWLEHRRSNQFAYDVYRIQCDQPTWATLGWSLPSCSKTSEGHIEGMINPLTLLFRLCSNWLHCPMLSSGLLCISSSDYRVLGIRTEPLGSSHGDFYTWRPQKQTLLVVAFPLERTKQGGPAATVSISIKGVKMQGES